MCSFIEGATEEELNAKVVIVVRDAPPVIESHCVHRHRFDMQVVCVLRSKEKSKDPSKYDAIRYMRHEKHAKFWKQEKDDLIATKCITSVCSEMAHSFSEDDYFYSVVSVYVKRGMTTWKRTGRSCFSSQGVEKPRPVSLPHVSPHSHKKGRGSQVQVQCNQ